MKKSRVYIAIICMAIMAAAVAVVSCKKETTNKMVSGTSKSPQAFDPSHITDMNTYLKDFKQKMEESQNAKDAEYLSLAEAAWHLSCLANIDFCRINVKYDDFQFDTIEIQVNTTNDVMLMSDFCMAYQQICKEIQQFKKGFNHSDQNLYFIKVSIDAEGYAKIALMTSYTISSKDFYTHQWYFQDFFSAVYECYEYYSDDSTYVWNGLAADELQRVLNLYEHHENGFGPIGSLICYIPTRDHTFNYTNTCDPYGSEFFYVNDSRVFAKRYNQSIPVPNYIFDVYEMCASLDSYLGLGYEYINDHLYINEFPVNWTVTPQTKSYNTWNYIYHDLYVEYGRTYVVD